ncbi:MAG TPA: class I SAM-dependent methyltransferase [Ktedonobacterales bacterium]|nr:class I SAM-dependent methyltransferase [Ktedonobacterales bacterium]
MDPTDVLDNPWDAAAAAYGQHIARREQANMEQDPILSRMLELLGDLSGRDVLDAGCGEGFLARVLASHSARVTGIDLSARLIAMARKKDPHHAIAYYVGNLSRPLPAFARHFDRIGSHLALNDVADHRGFAATLASLARPDARVVLAFNNPYSSVVREHVTDYFANGALGMYGGLAREGIRAHYYHRTLEEYLDAFLSVGFQLAALADVTDQGGLPWLLPAHFRFPRFMILAFYAPGEQLGTSLSAVGEPKASTGGPGHEDQG